MSCWIENQTHCSYSSLYLSIFLSFKVKFLSQFSQELCKLESSNMVYICRMSDCIVGLRFRVIALILLFLSIFLSFLFCMFILKICVRVFSGSIETRSLKLCVHMEHILWYSVIVNQAHCSYCTLYLSIFLFSK